MREERDTLPEGLAPDDVPTSTGHTPADTTDSSVAERVFDQLVSTVIDRHIDAFKEALKASVHGILDEISNQAFRDREEMIKLKGRVSALERNQPEPDDGK